MLSGRVWPVITTQYPPLLAALSKRNTLARLTRNTKHLCWLSYSAGNTGSCRDEGGPDVETLCHKWCRLYESCGVPDPVDSAQLIISHALGKKMIHEVPPAFEVSEEMIQKIDTLCRQRLERKPVQYIIGEWDFLDMTLIMRPPVLIPRPETEELCELVKGDQQDKGRDNSPLQFLDIGCGSGAISLYLLKHLPQSSCIALDKSPEACDLTQENADKLGLATRISVLQGDILQDSLVEQLSRTSQFDMIVSNPPYIPSADMETLMPEVIGYEAHEALHGGRDGLDIIRKILDVSRSLLKAKGCVWLETDISHPSKITELVASDSDLQLEFVGVFKDFTKRPRFFKLKRS